MRTPSPVEAGRLITGRLAPGSHAVNEDRAGEARELRRDIGRSLERHVVDRVLEPADARSRLQRQGALDVALLAEPAFGRVCRLSRWQDQDRAAHTRQQLGWARLPQGPEDLEMIRDRQP